MKEALGAGVQGRRRLSAAGLGAPVPPTIDYKLCSFLIAFFAALHRKSRSPSGR